MISLDDKQIKQLEARLDGMVKDGFPKATRDTLNITVANGRKSARRMALEQMTIKGAKGQNPALRGIQFEQTQSLNPRNQVAKLGHTAPFWPLQEFGGVVVKKSSEGIAIPTGAAANQAGSTKRTKAVAKRNRLSNIRLNRDIVRAKNRKQRNAILIAEARKPGASKEVFLDLGRRKGIFRVKRNEIVMLHDLSHDVVFVPPNPTIFPAAERQAKFIPEVYQRRLEFYFRRAQRGQR